LYILNTNSRDYFLVFLPIDQETLGKRLKAQGTDLFHFVSQLLEDDLGAEEEQRSAESLGVPWFEVRS
jgi:hypothetical protein